jgi:hypothetical protein
MKGLQRDYNERSMAIALIRRIVFAALGVWVSVLAVEEFRLSGHTTPAIGLSLAGIVLFVLAATGKGG